MWTCLRYAQTQQKKLFVQDGDDYKMVKKLELLGKTFPHENIIYLLEAMTSILLKIFFISKDKIEDVIIEDVL